MNTEQARKLVTLHDNADRALANLRNANSMSTDDPRATELLEGAGDAYAESVTALYAEQDTLIENMLPSRPIPGMVDGAESIIFDGSPENCTAVTEFLGGIYAKGHRWKHSTYEGGFVTTPSGEVEFGPGDRIVRTAEGFDVQKITVFGGFEPGKAVWIIGEDGSCAGAGFVQAGVEGIAEGNVGVRLTTPAKIGGEDFPEGATVSVPAASLSTDASKVPGAGEKAA